MPATREAAGRLVERERVIEVTQKGAVVKLSEAKGSHPPQAHCCWAGAFPGEASSACWDSNARAAAQARQEAALKLGAPCTVPARPVIVGHGVMRGDSPLWLFCSSGQHRLCMQAVPGC